MNASSLALILTGVFLNASAQLLLKAGAAGLRDVELALANAGPIAMQLGQNPAVLAGLACYAISVVVWILALARVDVSVAYPMLSLGYIVSAAGAWWLFDENVSPLRVAGILTIVAGTWLVARSS